MGGGELSRSRRAGGGDAGQAGFAAIAGGWRLLDLGAWVFPASFRRQQPRHRRGRSYKLADTGDAEGAVVAGVLCLLRGQAAEGVDWQADAVG